MPYGKHDIAFTLGRLQPPHQAHFNMLFAALLSLNKNGQLIQFIGSTNVERSFSEHEKNFLSFDERAAMLTSGLIESLHDRYEQDPTSIPAKFASRIQQGMPVLEPEDFICVPLPDFSDTHRILTEDIENIRTQAMAQVAQIGLPDHPDFLHIMKYMTTQYLPFKNMGAPDYSPSYLGWAVNLRNVLTEIVEQYKIEHRIKRPKVRFQSCAKDAGTLHYILLIATVIEFFEHDYDVDLAFIPVTMLDAYASVNATDIRQAFVNIVSDSSDEKLQYFIANPASLVQQYPVLIHMRPQARVVMLKALMKLKAEC